MNTLLGSKDTVQEVLSDRWEVIIQILRNKNSRETEVGGWGTEGNLQSEEDRNFKPDD